MDRFGRVSVVANPAALKTITWTVENRAGMADPSNFYVDKARSGGEWDQIAGPLPNACLYVDPVIWDWNKDKNTFYRVRVQVAGTWEYSVPIQAIGEWNREDYLKAREICRKEYLLMRKSGEDGLLLKRREWGSRCTCVDADTKEVTNKSCPLCLGTGITGGYYPSIPLPIGIQEPPGRNRVLGEAGLAHDEVRMARAVAYPLITSNDIWIGNRTNERWQVRAIKTVAEIRRIPLVQVLELRLIPQTDVIYGEEATAKALETPPATPSGDGNEHGWKAVDATKCLNNFDY